MSEWTADGYLRALRFAAEAHGSQIVPGTKHPYVVHVALVCMEVIAALRQEPAHDQELAVQSALLHDVVEDTATTLDQVRDAFGTAVANGVSALSKDKAIAKDAQLEDSLRRIREQPAEIWMVKMADRITNLQPPPAHWTMEKRVGYRHEAVSIHRMLKDASPTLAERLWKKIEGYRTFCVDDRPETMHDERAATEFTAEPRPAGGGLFDGKYAHRQVGGIIHPLGGPASAFGAPIPLERFAGQYWWVEVHGERRGREHVVMETAQIAEALERGLSVRALRGPFASRDVAGQRMELSWEAAFDDNED